MVVYVTQGLCFLHLLGMCVYVCVCNVFCYIYKWRVINVSDRPFVNLNLNNGDTELAAPGDCQLFTYVINRPYTQSYIVTHIYRKWVAGGQTKLRTVMTGI